MDRVYQLMSEQAQFWTDSWDQIDSKARKPIWGSSYAIYNPPKPAHDQTLPLPPAPKSDLEYQSAWSSENQKRIDLAAQSMSGNQTVTGLLHENMRLVQFNRYNLEVYLSIAELCRQNLEMIDGIHHMDAALASASKLRTKNPKQALSEIDRALDTARSIRQQRTKF